MAAWWMEQLLAEVGYPDGFKTSKVKAALDDTGFIRLVNEADNYAIAHRWIINILPKVSFCIYQLWLNRFNGQTPWFFGQSAGRYWIDQDLKEAMGY
jgi:hypothetical protein